MWSKLRRLSETRTRIERKYIAAHRDDPRLVTPGQTITVFRQPGAGKAGVSCVKGISDRLIISPHRRAR